MAAGFSEGFANGFGLVDAVLQRRERNETARQQADAEAAYKQAVLDRQTRIDQRDQTWHEEDVKRQRQNDDFERLKFGHTVDVDNMKAGLENADFNSQFDYRNRMAGVSEMNAETSRIQAQAAAAENQAQIEKMRLETQWAKEQKSRQDALMRVQANMIRQDPSTGLTTIHLTKGNEQNDLNDIQAALGVNVGKIAGDLQTFNTDLTHIKSALADPRYFQQNKQAVLKAFNDIDGADINQGVGDYDGDKPEFKGGKVIRKEISDVYPSPDGKGFVFNVKTTIEKNGKEYSDEGPMTQYRSSSPADNQIRVLGIPEIIQRIEGYDAVGQVLQANPDFIDTVNRVAGRSAKDGKKDITKVKVPVYDQNGMPAGDKEVLYNGESFIDPEKQIKTQEDQAEAAKWTAKAPSLDERRRKAEYVLNNRSQFKDRPDILQAAEQLIKGNQRALPPGLQDAERYSLSPALANVGVTAPQQQPRADNNEAVTRQQLINEINALTGGRFEIPADATIDQLRQWLNENKAQQQPSPKPPMNNQSWAVRGAKAVGEGVSEFGAKKQEQWSKALDAL